MFFKKISNLVLILGVFFILLGNSHASIYSSLKIGSTGGEVKELQEALGVKATGYFGPMTAQAVKARQAKNSLPSTGFFGAMSRNIWNSKTQTQVRPINITPDTTPVATTTNSNVIVKATYINNYLSTNQVYSKVKLASFTVTNNSYSSVPLNQLGLLLQTNGLSISNLKICDSSNSLCVNTYSSNTYSPSSTNNTFSLKGDEIVLPGLASMIFDVYADVKGTLSCPVYGNAFMSLSVNYVTGLGKTEGSSSDGFSITGPCSNNINTTSNVIVLSPNGRETLNQGEMNKISWKNGNEKVQIGLSDGSNSSSAGLIGWIELKGSPEGSVSWDAKSVKDLSGNYLTGVNPGRYKIIAVSKDNTGNYCVYSSGSSGSKCNTDLSDDYFYIGKVPQAPTSTPTTTNVVCIRYNTDGSCAQTGTVPTTSPIPRVMFWPGKVNQHIDLKTGVWTTDPDGVSGGGLSTMYPNDYGDRKLDYCKKWYPNTTSVTEYKTETTDTWRAGGNTGNYSASLISYECVQGKVNRSIVVLSQKNGETYTAGKRITINWRTTGFSSDARVSINLMKKDVYGSYSNTNLMTIGNLIDDGTESLIIPDNVPTGNNYMITVSVVDKGGNCIGGTCPEFAESGVFTINSSTVTSPKITVLSPNGGETFAPGQQISVRWQSLGYSPSATVSISLDKPDQGGYSNTFNISSINLTDDGSEIFTIPSNVPAGQYSVRVQITESGAQTFSSDRSDNLFTISPSSQTQTCWNGSVIPVGQTCPSPSYILTFDINYAEGITAPAPLVVNVGKSVNLPVTPIRRGYTFGGWSTAPSPSTQSSSNTYQAGSLYTPNSSLTFFAVWKQITRPTVSTSTVPKLIPIEDSGRVLGVSSYQFTKALTMGMRGDDVSMLQKFLNTQGYKVLETGYYGQDTKTAVTKFQEAHKDEILKKVGLENGTGDFYTSTINFVNNILLNSSISLE